MSSIRLLLLICLTACSQHEYIRESGKETTPKEKQDELFDPNLQVFQSKERSIVLLLPMTGPHESIGKGVLNSCLIADKEASNLDFHVVDTADASIEKSKVFDFFKNKNIHAIIGPVFSSEVKQYKAIFPKIPMFSLSNNLKVNSEHVRACGVSLEDEISAIVRYALADDIDSFLIMLPEGETGDQVLKVLTDELGKIGISDGDDLEIIRYTSISRKNATKHAKNSGKKAVFVINPILIIPKLENMHVFTLSSVALANPESWNDAIVAFANNDMQEQFKNKYYSTFGAYPKTLDIIAYDLIKIIGGADDGVDGDYEGCLGKFSVSKKDGFKRQLKIFRIKDSKLSATLLYDTDEKSSK